MKKGIVYAISILLLFLLMYWLNKDVPVRFRWEPTFDTNDRQPFGAYAFDQILKDSWSYEYYHTYSDLYDIASDMVEYPQQAEPVVDSDEDSDEGSAEDSDTVEIQPDVCSDKKYATAEIRPEYNLLIIANELSLDSCETKFLLKYVEKGGSAILAANSIFGPLEDTLNIHITTPLYYQYFFDLSAKHEEENVRFCAPDSGQTTFTIPEPLVNNNFEILDADKNTYFDSLYIISTDSAENAISLRYAIGEGNLILISNPLLFTNYGILNDSIHPYIWKHLAYLEGKPLMRTEYYEVGSQGGKSKSVFRVILGERAFKWAFYTTLAGLLIFMIFTAKRKQKIIPIIHPPANKMLAFVRSIAGLYLLKNNNADILLKKQIYWGENLKRKYGVDIVNEQHNYEFYQRVATKTHQPFDEIRRLFLDLGAIDETTSVSDDEMMRLVTKMDEL